MATEVQTNFYHSQYYTMITTKSKIIIVAGKKLNSNIVLYYNNKNFEIPYCFVCLCLPYIIIHDAFFSTNTNIIRRVVPCRAVPCRAVSCDDDDDDK